ncbi:MAG: hypothetical protein HQ553_16560 [Chloroflexi bacterium]|nr:hypothetical protein [Chloroflexota bacterium]
MISGKIRKESPEGAHSGGGNWGCPPVKPMGGWWERESMIVQGVEEGVLPPEADLRPDRGPEHDMNKESGNRNKSYMGKNI